ncbi:MAG: hypothetical protein JO091_03185 [Acidobacteriaceae bacterium]|nr:hypothetical protein [Acidobacteriaceae bacterium]
MTAFVRDLGHAVRMVVQSPGFTAIAVLTRALGIGANAVLFSIISGALLNPLVYPRSNELVVVSEKRGGGRQEPT